MKMLPYIILLLLLVLLAVNVSGWWDDSYIKCRNITIDNAGNGDVDDYALFFNVSYDADMQPDFDDLRFTNGSCNSTGQIQLYAELENKTDSDAAWGWVRVNVSGMMDLSMYYGNSTIAGDWDTSGNVWTPNYILVYHMNENIDGAGQTIIDHTANNFDGTTSGNPTTTNGMVSYSIRFDGTDDMITVGDVYNLSTYNYSIEIVTKTETDADDTAYFINKYESNNDRWYFRFREGGPPDTYQHYMVTGGVAAVDSIRSNAAYDTTWNHVLFTCNRTPTLGEGLVYINGTDDTDPVYDNCENTGVDMSNTGAIKIAEYTGTEYPQIIDELRLYKGVFTQSYATLSSRNMIGEYELIFIGNEENYTAPSYPDNETPSWETDSDCQSESYVEGYYWNLTTPHTISIGSTTVAYNIDGFLQGNTYGFSYNDSRVIAQCPGLYYAHFDLTFVGGNGNEYGFALRVNNITQTDCVGGATAALNTRRNVAFGCLLDLEAGDNVTIVVRNADAANDIDIYNMNCNLHTIAFNQLNATINCSEYYEINSSEWLICNNTNTINNNGVEKMYIALAMFIMISLAGFVSLGYYINKMRVDLERTSIYEVQKNFWKVKTESWMKLLIVLTAFLMLLINVGFTYYTAAQISTAFANLVLVFFIICLVGIIVSTVYMVFKLFTFPFQIVGEVFTGLQEKVERENGR